MLAVCPQVPQAPLSSRTANLNSYPVVHSTSESTEHSMLGADGGQQVSDT